MESPRPADPADADHRIFATKLAELFSSGAEWPGPGDVDDRVRACLAPGARAASGSPVQPSGWLVAVAEAAAAWAREGIGLDRVLLGYHEAIHDGLELAVAESPGVDAACAGRAGLLLGLLRAVTLASTSAYVDEYRFVARQHQTAAQTLVAALLSGHSRSTLARRAGIAIARAYQVVALHIPADDAEPRVAEAVALRRLRRVQAALASALGSRALSLLTTGGGTVLVPLDDSAGPELAGAFTMSAQALAVLTEAAGAGLTAVVLSGPTEQIPELAARAHELLELANGLGRPPGLYGIPDLAVEYQLSRPGPAREHLADLLAPIRGNPRLLGTLVMFLETGLDRMETARRLGVHPNSITHRLRRIHRLSGLDLGCPEGIARARAALLVHGLDTPDAAAREPDIHAREGDSGAGEPDRNNAAVG
ncbi:helix-turn-helix domain-containing protein [Nocardia sp. CDC153]|uniref:PucR family transcriptional regulator n=1 Tax=Nocardia sp. CDC153 TaxID=3112167 RepID=UPI002DBF5C54|nr:helix-turn-helix domain-containing protein [Nocardia sp. CDC153]MEC3958917.1 helix-turn-helix domain-containing protein [Nocardia sp. CDC153]